MAGRPKLNKPSKVKLTLTPDQTTRERLDRIADHYGKSITALVEQWAKEEAERLGVDTADSTENGK